MMMGAAVAPIKAQDTETFRQFTEEVAGLSLYGDESQDSLAAIEAFNYAVRKARLTLQNAN